MAEEYKVVLFTVWLICEWIIFERIGSSFRNESEFENEFFEEMIQWLIEDGGLLSPTGVTM